MKQHQLRAFLALAEGGSLTKAAATLNKTTAAVSKAIRELEDDFQVQLFHRTSLGMPLAEGGAVLLPRARAMLAELTRADEELRALRGQNEVHLRIGLTPAVSVLIGPEAIDSFMARMPSVRLEVYEYQREQMTQRLDDGTLDVVLYAVPSFRERPGDSRGELLYETDMALAAPRHGELAKATSLSALTDALWIYSDPTGAQQSYVRETFLQNGLEPPTRSAICSAASLGIALAIRLDALVMIAKPIAELHEQLSVVPVLQAAPRLRVYSMVRASAQSSAAVEAFLEVARTLTHTPVTLVL